MCMFGSGGSRGPDPVAQAQQVEADRQAQINQSVGSINSMFADPSRGGLYDRHREAVMDVNQTELSRQAEEAERRSRMQTARQGLLGGSAHADTEGELAGARHRGALQIGQHATAAAEALRQRDEQARLDAIRLASAGGNTGAAQQIASSGLRETLGQAGQAQAMDSLGDLFRNIGSQVVFQQMRAGAGGAPMAQQREQFRVGAPSSGFAGRIT